jgi:uncharacterized protein (DUF1697 family)
MTAVVSLLRGVNVGGHHAIKMDALRTLYESLDLHDPRTYVQSGNVVFRTREQDLAKLAERVEKAIERKFGFRPAIIVRTSSEMRDVVAGNPFAKRQGIEPSKLIVTFLAYDPGQETQDKLRKLKTAGEELQIRGRELYIYFPNGMGRSKLPALIDRTLPTPGTARNWNSVTKLLDMAEALESAP